MTSIASSQRAASTSTLLHINSSHGLTLQKWLWSEHFQPFWTQLRTGWGINSNTPRPTTQHLHLILSAGEPKWLDVVQIAVQHLMDQSRPEYRHAWKEDGGWTLQDHVVKFVVGVAEVNLRDGGLWHMWNPRRFDLNLDVEVVLARVAFLTLIAVQFVIFDDMEVLCEGYGGLPWHWYWTQEPENGALTVREQYAKAIGDPSLVDIHKYSRRQAFYYRSAHQIREVRRAQATGFPKFASKENEIQRSRVSCASTLATFGGASRSQNARAIYDWIEVCSEPNLAMNENAANLPKENDEVPGRQRHFSEEILRNIAPAEPEFAIDGSVVNQKGTLGGFPENIAQRDTVDPTIAPCRKQSRNLEINGGASWRALTGAMELSESYLEDFPALETLGAGSENCDSAIPAGEKWWL